MTSPDPPTVTLKVPTQMLRCQLNRTASPDM